jgi:hypothetical protein
MDLNPKEKTWPLLMFFWGANFHVVVTIFLERIWIFFSCTVNSKKRLKDGKTYQCFETTNLNQK